MLDLKNIILIFIILFLLNYLKFKPQNKSKRYEKKKSMIEKMTQVLDKNLLYGKEQYIVNNNFNEKFNYQNLEILKPNNLFEISSNLKFKYDANNDVDNINLINYDNRNLANKLKDTKVTKNPLSNEQIIKNFNEETKKAIINTPIYNINYPIDFASSKIDITPPTDQKMLYDYRFLDMNKDNLENIIHDNNIYNKNEGNTIKEIYDNLVFDYKKINQKKNHVNKNLKINGAFGESALPVDQWYYDNEINELSFDPNQNLELAVPIQENNSIV